MSNNYIMHNLLYVYTWVAIHHFAKFINYVLFVYKINESKSNYWTYISFSRKKKTKWQF
jgi:hypothetical protein